MAQTIGLGENPRTSANNSSPVIVHNKKQMSYNDILNQIKDQQVNGNYQINTIGLGKTEPKNEPYKAPEETRADKIYEEQKEREDTAWQRGVKDMLASGINPNLVNLSFNGATTGSGIMADQELQGEIDQVLKNNEIQLQGEIDKMLMKLDQEFKMDQAQKDRWNKTLNQLISTAGTIVGGAMKK